MIATCVRHSAARGLATKMPYNAFCRPLAVVSRAYKGDPPNEAPAAAANKEQSVAKQEPSAPVVHRSLPPVMRLPSLFHEMQREMDAMSRMFGLPSFFDQDPFFTTPPAMMLSQLQPQLPSMRVAVDVEEDDKAFVIKADTPGIPKESLKLSVLDGTLTISGERVEEKQEGLTADADAEAEGHTAAAPGLEPGAAAEGVGPSDVPAPATNHTHSSVSKRAPLRYERSYGRFSRSFSLPPNVDVEGISASAQDGVLTVTIPKLPKQQPAAKDIQVQ